MSMERSYPHGTLLDREEELKNAILQVLDCVEPRGPFLDVADENIFILPGLEIDGIGPIGLPVSPQIAKALISAGRPSAHVKSTKTICKDAPKRRELDADQFTFVNPAWETYLKERLSQALCKLGLSANATGVEMRPHKIFIDEEGTISLPHPVSGKDNGMLGTFSICLPSKHEGGDVTATWKGETATFRTAPCSAYSMTNIVSYADVIHESQKLTAGYRVVVHYNLYHAPSAALLSTKCPWEKLVALFIDWDKRARALLTRGLDWLNYRPRDCPAAVLHMLSRQYPDGWLGFDRLEGIDKTQVADLQKACEIVGMHVFLATVMKEVCEMDDDDCSSTRSSVSYGEISTISLPRLVGTSNSTVAKGLRIEEDIILDDKAFGRDPDVVRQQPRLDQHPLITRCYYHTGILIVPSRYSLSYLIESCQCSEDAHHILQWVTNRYRSEKGNEERRQSLLQACRAIIEKWVPREISEPHWSDSIPELGRELNDNDLVGRYVRAYSGLLPFGVLPSIASAIANGDFDTIVPLLDPFFSPNNDYCFRLQFLLQVEAACNLEDNKSSSTASEKVLRWTQVTFQQIVSSTTQLSDGFALANVFEDVLKEHPIRGLIPRIRPILERGVSNTNFIISLLESLAVSRVDPDEMRQAFAEFLPRILESFQFESLEYVTDSYDDDDPYGLPLRKEPHMKPLCPDLLGQFIDNYEKLIGYNKLTDETAPIYSTLIKHAKQLPEAKKAAAFGDVLLPFLEYFCKWIGSENGVPPQPFEINFVVAILDEYLNNCMRGPPERTVQWGELLSVKACTCEDCHKLQAFLCDPHRKEAKFPGPSAKRRHLKARLRPLATTLNITTLCVGSPYTLQVEKPSPEYEKNCALMEWDTKVSQAKDYMWNLK